MLSLQLLRIFCGHGMEFGCLGFGGCIYQLLLLTYRGTSGCGWGWSHAGSQADDDDDVPSSFFLLATTTTKNGRVQYML